MSEKNLNFIDHLEELRKRILYSIICVGIFSIAGFFFAQYILDMIINQAQLQSVYFFAPLEAFTTHIKIAIFIGLFISFPFILYQSWAFIGPGLTKTEKKISLSYMFFGILLFLVGNLFGYFILIPLGLKFLLSFGSDYLQPLMNVGKYIGFIFWCLLGSGILFQLPLMLFFLIKLGVIDVKTVRKHRPEAIVVILILCAIITPTGDFFTLLLISIPLLLLFELSVLIAGLTQKKAIKKTD
jgi:sec-independent protein translocase protein TatC